jgi:hypothetical protein
MTSRRYFGIVLRLALVIGVGAGVVDAVRNYNTAVSHKNAEARLNDLGALAQRLG